MINEQELRTELIKRLCELNGWEVGSEDGEAAIEQVDWFTRQLVNLGVELVYSE